MTKLFLVIILTTLCTGCSLTGKVDPIKYFTLNPIKNSCLRSVEISGSSHLLTEKIMLKKEPHAIGSIASAYWIIPLQTMLSEILISDDGQKDIFLKINELILNVDTKEVVLSAVVKNCLEFNCNEKIINSKIRTTTETLDIIKSYQEVLNQAIQEICSEDI